MEASDAIIFTLYDFILTENYAGSSVIMGA